ncbi:MAG: sodium/calcium exchanger protein [Bacillota bacterium]
MWLLLFGSAILIFFAGMQLTRNAEKISASLNMSTTWAGALLLPLATTLPELVSSRRAVIIGAPDLAGGNIYGSILFKNHEPVPVARQNELTGALLRFKQPLPRHTGRGVDGCNSDGCGGAGLYFSTAAPLFSPGYYLHNNNCWISFNLRVSFLFKLTVKEEKEPHATKRT